MHIIICHATPKFPTNERIQVPFRITFERLNSLIEIRNRQNLPHKHAPHTHSILLIGDDRRTQGIEAGNPCGIAGSLCDQNLAHMSSDLAQLAHMFEMFGTVGTHVARFGTHGTVGTHDLTYRRWKNRVPSIVTPRQRAQSSFPDHSRRPRQKRVSNSGRIGLIGRIGPIRLIRLILPIEKQFSSNPIVHREGNVSSRSIFPALA